jgi:type IV secretory pathway VirB10-like protein
MKRLAIAFAIAAAGLGLACRGGETRPAAEPSAESKSAEAARAERDRPAGQPATRPAEPSRAANPMRPADTSRPADESRLDTSRPADRPVREAEAPRPAPTPRPLVIADGTDLVLALTSTLSSDRSRPEDVVEATLAEPVRADERTAIPEGSVLRGHVLVAQRSGKTKGLARLAVSFDRLVVNGKTYAIEASPIDVTAQKSTGRDAKIIGGAAAAGALIGAIADGGSGAAKGGLIGGAAGGGAVLLTRGKEVEMPAGSKHTVRLTRSVILD